MPKPERPGQGEEIDLSAELEKLNKKEEPVNEVDRVKSKREEEIDLSPELEKINDKDEEEVLDLTSEFDELNKEEKDEK